MPRNYLFTSESVTEGHPDKIADQISDAVLDAILEQDPMSRVACETFVTTGMAMIGGEITTSGYVDMQNVARDMIKEIGYTDSSYGLDWETCAVLTSIDRQSADIAMGVDRLGAGDQGIDRRGRVLEAARARAGAYPEVASAPSAVFLSGARSGLSRFEKRMNMSAMAR